MIVKIFNHGWFDLPIPKMINNAIQQIKDGYVGNQPTILVDSTWYTDEIHEKIKKFILDEGIKRVIITSMADAHIPHKGFYEGLGVDCFEIGYYPGEGFYDLWASAFHKLHLRVPDQQLLNQSLIEKPFMCLNRKHHEHRVRIVNELRSAGLTDKGIVTLSGTDLRIENDAPDHVSVAPESGADVVNDVVTLGRTDIWCSHFLNVVTETWWDINRAYLAADKYFKPLVGLRPFLIWSEDMGVEWLTDRKFELYHDDFQDITDLNLRDHENMIPFLTVLSDQPKAYLQQKYLDLRDKLLYNRSRFDEYVQEQDLNAVIERMNQFLR